MPIIKGALITLFAFLVLLSQLASCVPVADASEKGKAIMRRFNAVERLMERSDGYTFSTTNKLDAIGIRKHARSKGLKARFLEDRQGKLLQPYQVRVRP
jgi:hypothetical protein